MTDNNFELLISELSKSPVSIDTIDQIKTILEQQTNDLLSSFISQSLESLISLEHWTWTFFSRESHEWIDEKHYLDLFHTLASFNFLLVFHKNHIEDNIKFSLLIPDDINLINQIFKYIETIEDENNPFFNLISRWFDNVAYFIHEHTEFETSPILLHIYQYIGHNYLLNEQYKFYLTQLCESQIPESIFTGKQLFYIKTCSFIFRMYICSKCDKQPFNSDQLFNQYGNDFLEIILVHNHTVSSWDNQLLTCIAHLIDFICACCWWGSDRSMYIKKLISSEQLFYDFIQGLIRIVGYKALHERITSQWNNDETILIDSACIFLIGAIFEIKNLSCFLRAETTLSNIILEITQKSTYDRISICAYGILAEILSDEQLKEVKINDNISEFFFRILELAWNHPTQRYKRLPIEQLLKGFLTLSKNDTIQEKTVRSNKLPLLIEMCDKYPITLNVLWSLSFNQNIQHQLRSNRPFMSKLASLKEDCQDEKMKKTIFGVLWNLELNQLDRMVSSDVPMFDIMISYSHKDETICKQIYEELVKAGYRVWIDFDQMHGNVMDAMAQAIEQSNTVLICMSEQYRKSNYCRAEAHYAFQRQLKIVPILLQEHYQPDGWLLFLIGQLLYVDFTKYEFPRAMEKLIEELRSSMKHDTHSKPVHPEPDSSFEPLTPSIEPPQLPENILDWTQKHVQNWLLGYNLRQMARLLNDFDGTSLHSLWELVTNNDPQQVLTLFQEDAHRRINENISLLELARFRTLLNERQQQQQQQSVEKDSNKLHFLNYCQIM